MNTFDFLINNLDKEHKQKLILAIKKESFHKAFQASCSRLNN